jgi:hypothetical protein
MLPPETLAVAMYLQQNNSIDRKDGVWNRIPTVQAKTLLSNPSCSMFASDGFSPSPSILGRLSRYAWASNGADSDQLRTVHTEYCGNIRQLHTEAKLVLESVSTASFNIRVGRRFGTLLL